MNVPMWHGGEYKLCKCNTPLVDASLRGDGSSVQIAQCLDCEGEIEPLLPQVRYELQCLTMTSGHQSAGGFVTAGPVWMPARQEAC